MSTFFLLRVRRAHVRYTIEELANLLIQNVYTLYN